ncbi:MAG: tRNA pseudouridine(55) synthase TruB [Acidobacteria bacterium]|nr:tRNA pseudouridine(55) synthase TruB [Acidobacteriota bacterium]
MDGVLVIDKPPGPTSHDVVAWARRVLREKRIGHTGTLDPLATGVLPLVIGRATRLASLLSSAEKEYEASVRLGAATDTYDATARLAAGGPPPTDPQIEPGQVEEALAGFRGTFEQMPPPYSAKKVGGIPGYRLARKNAPTTLSPVSVTVQELTLLGIESGLIRLRVVGSPGFYVRSLAHDLGVRLGCGGHLETLRRTRAGRFALDVAVRLEDLERDALLAESRLVPIDAMLPDLPAVQLNERGARKASHGNSLSSEDLAETGPGPDLHRTAGQSGPGPGRVRLMDPDGRLLGIAESGADGLLRPSIVLV